MAILKDTLHTIGKTVRDAIDTSTSNSGTIYQSPLECVGICKREVMKPLRYYGKQYPYALPIEVSMVQNNVVSYDWKSAYSSTQNSYVATSGWRPERYSLKTEIQDKEYQTIISNFDEQLG